jgi:hypothetical protein
MLHIVTRKEGVSASSAGKYGDQYRYFNGFLFAVFFLRDAGQQIGQGPAPEYSCPLLQIFDLFLVLLMDIYISYHSRPF